MDERRFDAIARFLDVIQTRRGTLRDALAGVLALAVAASPNLAEAVKKSRKKKKRKKRRRRRRRGCPSGQTKCFGACTNTSSDPRNCGFCGVDCDEDEVCSNGNCVDTGCDGGLTRCGNACVNTNTDPLNCGGCGNTCEEGQRCRGGVCGCDVCDDEEECRFQSVQAAVDAANPGDTITICRGTYAENITIDKTLNLSGAGNGATTLKGNETGSVVTIGGGAEVLIRDVLITGGSGTSDLSGVTHGGGILNFGTLTLRGCGVNENTADRGAGILNSDGADLTLDRTDVNENESTGSGNSSAGGGILNSFAATLTVTNGCIIQQNEARNGGGIFNNGTANVADCEILNNVADGNGGGFLNSSGELTLRTVIVFGNAAGAAGGGLFNASGTVQIMNNSEFADNTADEGGGIFNQLNAHTTLTSSAISGSEANLGAGVYNRGGHLTLVASTIVENDADDTGGGIFNTFGGTVALDGQSSVVRNDPNNCVGTNACGV